MDLQLLGRHVDLQNPLKIVYTPGLRKLERGSPAPKGGEVAGQWRNEDIICQSNAKAHAGGFGVG